MSPPTAKSLKPRCRATQTSCVAVWRRHHWLIATVACTAISLGCGRADVTAPANLVQVAGRITLEEQPLARVGVLFVPVHSGTRARGISNESGEFRLLHESQAVGIALGEYDVVIEPIVTSTNQPIPALDEDYRRPETTPVRVTIAEKCQNLDIRLTRDATDYRN
jgi:hypothetical protein